jgi:hypothetical protein
MNMRLSAAFCRAGPPTRPDRVSDSTLLEKAVFVASFGA